MSYQAVGMTNDEWRQAGLTGKKLGIWDLVEISKDSIKRKIYEDAKAAAVKLATAKSQTEIARAEKQAIESGQAAATAVGPGGTILGMSTTTFLLVGGGLAALAAVLVLKKKKRGGTAAA